MKTALLILLLAISVSFAATPVNNSGASTATKPAPNPVTQLLEKYDVNHNGKLDTAEIKMVAQLEQALAQELKPFDLNKDNKLDAEELDKWAAFKKAGKGATSRG